MTVTLLQGDCREVLRTLPAGSVHCAVTSPPYFGLRDYGMANQIGLEKSPDAYIAELVAVFREVWRVLRDDGTLWLNLGDSYAGSGRGGSPTSDSSTLQGSTSSQAAASIKRARKFGEIGETARQAAVTARGSRLPAGLHEGVRQAGNIGRAWVAPPSGYKHKELMGMPWRVALALQADGWYLRQDIIWHKPNPMPESVRDRCTKAHEYIFMLSKSRRYYFDADAIAEPVTKSTIERISQPTLGQQQGSDRVPGKTNGRMKAVVKKQDQVGKRQYTGLNDRYFAGDPSLTRNRRSVWTVTTKPFKGAHFATFPPDLIEPCVLAGAPPSGLVLDPFGGAGTTGLVAAKHGRDAILIELNPDYVDMSRNRLGMPAVSEIEDMLG